MVLHNLCQQSWRRDGPLVSSVTANSGRQTPNSEPPAMLFSGGLYARQAGVSGSR